MVHTVGIAGVNGAVGQNTIPELAAAAQDGRIRLVVFHRASSTPKNVTPSENIEFRILNFDDPGEVIEKAIAGINVFVSVVGSAGLPHEPAVVDALARSPDLETYIPSAYSLPWSEEDHADPRLGPILKSIHTGEHRAKELGVPTTRVYTSMFDVYRFEYGFLASSLGSDQIVANEKQLQNRLPITSLAHLGHSLAHLATLPAHTIVNRSYSCVTFWPTGQDLVNLHTKLTGKAPEIKAYTPAMREEQMNDAPNFGPVQVGYWDRWERGAFEGMFGEDAAGMGRVEYEGPGLEQVAKQFMKQ